MRNLFISFSGGETSAYMTLWCYEHLRTQYDEIEVVFANTGQERPETLEFVHRFSTHFDIPVTYVEAVVHHGKRKGSTHKVVTHATASRQGEPFEDVIRKYGIPNRAYPHCTRELKMLPMHSYIKSLGWEDYNTAVGIRVGSDECCGAGEQHNLPAGWS